MKNLNAILLLVGESGSGKTTIANELEKHGLKQLRSYTTRSKRYENEDCHTFVSLDQYHQLQNIVAETYFDGNYYCATTDQVNQNDVYVIDVDGVKSFYDKYNGAKIPVVFYISVPESERAARMTARGDADEQIQQRIEHDRKAFEDIGMYADYVIKNVELDKAVAQILDAVHMNKDTQL